MDQVLIKKPRYGGWEVCEASRTATARFGEQDVAVDLSCGRANGVVYQGLYGRDPTKDSRPITVVTGLCLWDARWIAEFAVEGKGGSKNPPARRSIALPSERNAVFERLSQGRRIAIIETPLEPGPYHAQLARWQAARISELNPEQILFHLPVDEYHQYIEDLQRAMGWRELETVHQALDDYAEVARQLVERTLGSLYERVTFVRPLQMGARSVEESWVMPYADPLRFGGSRHAQIVGVEDLVELRQVVTTGTQSALFAVLDPQRHPYFIKEGGQVRRHQL